MVHDVLADNLAGVPWFGVTLPPAGVQSDTVPTGSGAGNPGHGA